MSFVVNGNEVTIQVRSIPDDQSTKENRFGVSLSHAMDFINAYKNQQIGGYKMCNKYPVSSISASPHAETFAWNILEYKVLQL